MQPSERQPAGESAGQRDENRVESEPLYEFPAGGPPLSAPPVPAPVTQKLPEEEEAGQLPLAEAIQRGFVYPPPPDFYHNMPEAPVRPPLPPSNAPAAYHNHGYMNPGGQAPLAPYAPAPAPARRSRKWVWFVVAFFSLALLGSCAACLWAAYAYIAPLTQQLTGALNITNDYYNNIEARNYTAAYRDLNLQGQNPLSQEQFIQQAQARDEQYGPVTSYTLGQPAYSTNPNTGPDFSRLTIPVSVLRGQYSYTAVLTVQKQGGSWKIVDFYNI